MEMLYIVNERAAHCEGEKGYLKESTNPDYETGNEQGLCTKKQK